MYGSPPHPCSTWGESCLSFYRIPVSLWQAGWLAGDICLSVYCSCAYAWGGHQGPPPHVILALSMQGPQCLHFVCVPSSVLLSVVYVCSLVLWPVCSCACVAVLVCESAPPVCPYGICLSIPVSVLCPQLSPREREGSTAAPPINLDLTVFL